MPEPGNEDAIVLFNEDGSFGENWFNHESFEEGVRGHESLQTVTDLPNMAKQLVHANQMIGKNKVAVPGPNATDEEKSEFFKAIGRPETAGDYSFKVPEGLNKVFTDDKMASAKEFAHQIGATQEQFEAFMAREAQSVAQAAQDAAAAREQDKLNAIDEMKKRFGAAFDERMHIANRLIADICKGDADESRKIALLEAFGNNAEFMEFCSDAGAKLVEHKALIGELTSNTPKEALAKLDELRATPGFIVPDENGQYLSDTDPAKKKHIMAEIDRLTKEAYPEAREQRRDY